MPFYKHLKKPHGRDVSRVIQCYKCGTIINFGDVYYSKTTKRVFSQNMTKHMCEPCYENQFIVVN